MKVLIKSLNGQKKRRRNSRRGGGKGVGGVYSKWYLSVALDLVYSEKRRIPSPPPEDCSISRKPTLARVELNLGLWFPIFKCRRTHPHPGLSRFQKS